MTPERTTPAARERAIGGLEVGEELPDFELLDHAGNHRRLSALVGGTRRSCSSSEVGGAPRSRRSSGGSSCCRMTRRSPTRGSSRSASIDPRSTPRCAPASGPAGHSCRTRIATSSLSWVFARRPTPSTIRTCPRCWWLIPDAGSSRRTTATGTGGGRRTASSCTTSASSPGRFAPTGTPRRREPILVGPDRGTCLRRGCSCPRLQAGRAPGGNTRGLAPAGKAGSSCPACG